MITKKDHLSEGSRGFWLAAAVCQCLWPMARRNRRFARLMGFSNDNGVLVRVAIGLILLLLGLPHAAEQNTLGYLVSGLGFVLLCWGGIEIFKANIR